MTKIFGVKVFSFMETNKNIKVHIDDLDGEGLSELYKKACLVLINRDYYIEDVNRVRHLFESFYKEETEKEYFNKLLHKEIVNFETELSDKNELIITLLVSNEETAYLNRL